jgi:hypothetical protein
METIKIQTSHFVEIEFNVPKYFKIANHYQMILDENNYLFVKANLENSLLIYPEISINPISYSASSLVRTKRKARVNFNQRGGIY